MTYSRCRSNLIRQTSIFRVFDKRPSTKNTIPPQARLTQLRRHSAPSSRRVISVEKLTIWFPRFPVVAHLLCGIYFHVAQCASLCGIADRPHHPTPTPVPPPLPPSARDRLLRQQQPPSRSLASSSPNSRRTPRSSQRFSRIISPASQPSTPPCCIACCRPHGSASVRRQRLQIPRSSRPRQRHHLKAYPLGRRSSSPASSAMPSNASSFLILRRGPVKRMPRIKAPWPTGRPALDAAPPRWPSPFA